MDKPLIQREVAEADVTAWLDHKKMSSKRREEKKEAIESLIAYVEDGTVIIDKDKGYTLIQNLAFPIGEQVKIEKLEWKPYGNVGKFQIHMKNVESADFTGNAIARACAQTNQSKTIINALDSEDETVLKVIAVFFM